MKTNYLREFFKHISTNVVGTIGLSTYVFADTYFISLYAGSLGLAALNISLPIYSLIYGLGYLLGIGGGINFTYSLAKDRRIDANSYFDLTVTFGILFGLMLTFVGLFFPTQISYFLGANSESIGMSVIYIRTILIFSPLFILSTILLCFLRYDDNPKLAMIAMLASNFFNIVADYIFMAHLDMGIFGAALATGLSPVLAIAIIFPHFTKKRGNVHFSKLYFNVKRFFEVARLGLSTFVYEMSAGLVIFVYNYLILGINGNIGIAAYGVVANLATILLSIFNGIQQGIQPLISYSHSRDDKLGVKTYLKYGITLALMLSTAVYIFSLVNIDLLISIFNSENNQILHDLAKAGIIIYFAGFIPASLNVVIIAYKNATNNARVSFIMSLARGSVFVLLFALLLSYSLGMTGIWLSFPLAEIATLILYGIFLKMHI